MRNWCIRRACLDGGATRYWTSLLLSWYAIFCMTGFMRMFLFMEEATFARSATTGWENNNNAKGLQISIEPVSKAVPSKTQDLAVTPPPVGKQIALITAVFVELAETLTFSAYIKWAKQHRSASAEKFLENNGDAGGRPSALIEGTPGLVRSWAAVSDPFQDLELHQACG